MNTNFIMIYSLIALFAMIVLIITAYWLSQEFNREDKVASTYQLTILILSFAIMLMAIFGMIFWHRE